MILQIFSAIFGFSAPFLPQLLKYFERKQDNAHELKMFEMRMSMAAQEHLWRIEEINTNADITEMKVLRQPQKSFGVQLLDAARTWVTEKKWGAAAVLPIFYLFSTMDFFIGMVRPSITYLMVAFYIVYKWTMFRVLTETQGQMEAILSSWGDQDWSVLVLVISYWFGARTAKAVFGGSAGMSDKDG